MNGLRKRIAGKAIVLTIGAAGLLAALPAGPANADGIANYFSDPYAHNIGTPAASCTTWMGVSANGMANTKFYAGYWRTILYRSFDNGRTWALLDNTQPWYYGGGTQQYSSFTQPGLYGIYHVFTWWIPPSSRAGYWTTFHYMWETCRSL